MLAQKPDPMIDDGLTHIVVRGDYSICGLRDTRISSLSESMGSTDAATLKRLADRLCPACSADYTPPATYTCRDCGKARSLRNVWWSPSGFHCNRRRVKCAGKPKPATQRQVTHLRWVDDSPDMSACGDEAGRYDDAYDYLARYVERRPAGVCADCWNEAMA